MNLQRFFKVLRQYNTDVTEFLGNYGLFPHYLASPELLSMVKWNEYRFLLSCYQTTIGKNRLQGNLTEKTLQRVGFTSWITIKRALDGLKEDNLITDKAYSQDLTLDPIFHIQQTHDNPRKWKVTFLFPMSHRLFGNRRVNRPYTVKLWYIGNKEQNRELKVSPVKFFDAHSNWGALLVDITASTRRNLVVYNVTGMNSHIAFIPSHYDDGYKSKQECEIIIQSKPANEEGHFYFYFGYERK